MYGKVTKVKIGKLYSSHFRKAMFSDKSPKTFFSSYIGDVVESQPFVVLEAEEVFDGYGSSLYHLKILTADGMLGYIKIDPFNLKAEKLNEKKNRKQGC